MQLVHAILNSLRQRSMGGRLRVFSAGMLPCQPACTWGITARKSTRKVKLGANAGYRPLRYGKASNGRIVTFAILSHKGRNLPIPSTHGKALGCIPLRGNRHGFRFWTARLRAAFAFACMLAAAMLAEAQAQRPPAPSQGGYLGVELHSLARKKAQARGAPDAGGAGDNQGRDRLSGRCSGPQARRYRAGDRRQVRRERGTTCQTRGKQGSRHRCQAAGASPGQDAGWAGQARREAGPRRHRQSARRRTTPRLGRRCGGRRQASR